MKDHAAEVARFKAAKEQAEVAQAQVKKEMDAAIERMKTQFLFKVNYSVLLPDVQVACSSHMSSNTNSSPPDVRLLGP